MNYTKVISAIQTLLEAFQELQAEQEGRTVKKKRKGRAWTPEQRAVQKAKTQERWNAKKAQKAALAIQASQKRHSIKPLGGMKKMPAMPSSIPQSDPHEILRPRIPRVVVDTNDPKYKF